MSTVDVNPRTGIGSPILLADIFYSILDYFCPEHSPEERKTLASLARTCRALSDPSLNRLWKTLRSFDPLIRCYAGTDIENAIPPSSLQLAIIDRYAYRVKELVVTGNTALRLLQSTVMRACSFPNLRILRWNPNLSPHIPLTLIQPFINLQLISLELSFAAEDNPTLRSFFDDYLLCRNLRTFEVQFEDKALSQTTAEALSSAICRQKNLENVVVNVPISDAALGHLSTLPTLRRLSVHLRRETLGQQTGSSLPTEPVFYNVEDLAFETSDLELLTSLIQPHSQNFHSFRLICNDRLTSEAMVTFLNVLASRSPKKPLHTLTLTCGNLSPPMPVDWMVSEAQHYHLSYGVLQPLKVFGSLRYLRIVWSEQLSMDDVELADLVSNWPLLGEFHITCSRGSHPPFLTKYPTLRSLLTLVSSCPELRAITLPLDATHVPEVQEIEHFDNLEALAVPESPIDQSLPVAQFLFHLFPALEILDARYGYPPGADFEQLMVYDGTWQQVQDHIEEFRGLSPSYCSYDSDSDDDELGGFLIGGS